MRKHRADKIIAIVTIILMLVGLIVVFAIGGRVAQAENAASGKNYSDTYFVIRHGAVVVASIVALFAAYKIPYELLDKILYRSLEKDINANSIADELNIEVNDVNDIINRVNRNKHKTKVPESPKKTTMVI